MKATLVDESNEAATTKNLIFFFRRRIDQIDIERYRLIQRLRKSLAHVYLMQL